MGREWRPYREKERLNISSRLRQQGALEEKIPPKAPERTNIQSSTPGPWHSWGGADENAPRGVRQNEMDGG
ncbi:hypothetical protein TNCV_2664621 [Trichonephila clavipes]|nr:hypothetical protein TNCV_2664621 [Trichonephila clavipes]